MSDNRCIKYREEEDEEQNKEIIDEECYKEETVKKEEKKQLRTGAQKATGKDKRETVKVDLLDMLDMIDTYDREGNAYTETKYARSGTYAVASKNQLGKRIPKIGSYTEACTGRARAKYGIFDVEIKGPNFSNVHEASLHGVGAMTRAEFVSASAKAGPLDAKVGLGVDTGASIGLDGVEAKVLGTGFSAGPAGVGVSFLGSEVKLSCAVM